MSKNRISKVKKFIVIQEKKLEEVLKSLETELVVKKIKEIKLKYADK